MHIYINIWKWPASRTGTVPIISAHFRSLWPVTGDEKKRILNVNHQRRTGGEKCYLRLPCFHCVHSILVCDFTVICLFFRVCFYACVLSNSCIYVCYMQNKYYLLTYLLTRKQRGIVVSGVRRMNEVNPRLARLVPGWVTVFGRVHHLIM